jgi:hypothetical protein
MRAGVLALMAAVKKVLRTTSGIASTNVEYVVRKVRRACDLCTGSLHRRYRG